MQTYYFIACTAIKSSQTLLLLHHILLHHMHCSHFITCPAITSSHTLLLLHHIHCSYFITGYVRYMLAFYLHCGCRSLRVLVVHLQTLALMVSVVQILALRIDWIYMPDVYNSSHALILLYHMHCYYFLTCSAITSPYALLLLHHMYCY